MSELRGMALVVVGLGALAYFWSWWFQAERLTSPWLVLGFVIAMAYSVFQILGNWTVYLFTHHRPRRNSSSILPNLTVDVFVTACGEPYHLIERSLAAACVMRGAHRTWLLDDGHDPGLEALARRLRAGYLTRDSRKDAKAGNLNAALARTEGDVVVIFDIDHVAQPNFLEATLPLFADAKVGFVQVMLNFCNHQDGWVAAAAADTSLDYYNPTSLGADGLTGATLVGSNTLIRRLALESIGGYRPGLAEDLATSIALHAAGWRSVYVPEPLAPGMAPPDMASWFTQQLKWARGVFELLLTAYPRCFPRLTVGQRVAYAVRMTYYWIGIVAGAHVVATLAVLAIGTEQAWAAFEDYLRHLAPLGFMVLTIRLLALRRWRNPIVNSGGTQLHPLGLVYFTWPIYSLAWFMAMARLPLGFRPTPKAAAGGLKFWWIAPQLAIAGILSVGLFLTILAQDEIYPFAYVAVAAQIAAHLMVPGEELFFRTSHAAPGDRPRIADTTRRAVQKPASDDLDR